MEPDPTSGAIDNPPSGQPRQPIPDFFASREVVMPQPEPDSARAGVASPPAYSPPPAATPPYAALQTPPTYAVPQPDPTYGQSQQAAPTWGTPPPGGYPATAPWGGSVRSRRKSLVPAAVATAVLLVVGLVAVAFGVNKGGSALSNTQMLALVHSASTGLTRSPATTFTMTMTMSGEGHQETVNMSGVGSRDNREASFTMTGPGVTESMVFLNGVAYVQLPAEALSMNDGKPWIGVRTPNPTAEQQQLESSGPAGMLQSLSTFGGTVKDDGNATVRGVQTTKYSVEMNLQSMIQRESALTGAGTSPAINNLGLNQNFPMSIWIDKQGLPRELTMSFNINGIAMEAVAYFTPTNVMPVISAPPVSEVNMYGSLSDFESRMQQLSATG